MTPEEERQLRRQQQLLMQRARTTPETLSPQEWQSFMRSVTEPVGAPPSVELANRRGDIRAIMDKQRDRTQDFRRSNPNAPKTAFETAMNAPQPQPREETPKPIPALPRKGPINVPSAIEMAQRNEKPSGVMGPGNNVLNAADLNDMKRNAPEQFLPFSHKPEEGQIVITNADVDALHESDARAKKAGDNWQSGMNDMGVAMVSPVEDQPDSAMPTDLSEAEKVVYNDAAMKAINEAQQYEAKREALQNQNDELMRQRRDAGGALHNRNTDLMTNSISKMQSAQRQLSNRAESNRNNGLGMRMSEAVQGIAEQIAASQREAAKPQQAWDEVNAKLRNLSDTTSDFERFNGGEIAKQRDPRYMGMLAVTEARQRAEAQNPGLRALNAQDDLLATQMSLLGKKKADGQLFNAQEYDAQMADLVAKRQTLAQQRKVLLEGGTVNAQPQAMADVGQVDLTTPPQDSTARTRLRNAYMDEYNRRFGLGR